MENNGKRRIVKRNCEKKRITGSLRRKRRRCTHTYTYTYPYKKESVVMSGRLQQQQSGHQSQIVCNGCNSWLLYPQGASNVRCVLCNHVTSVPPTGSEMAYLVCGGCRTLLSYMRGATSVQCSECSTVNLAIQAHQIAHITCGGCNLTLMYAHGATSVSCASCHFVTHIAENDARYPLNNNNNNNNGAGASGRGATTNNIASNTNNNSNEVPRRTESHLTTVVVQNPDTLDDNGQLVHNIAVGITDQKTVTQVQQNGS